MYWCPWALESRDTERKPGSGPLHSFRFSYSRRSSDADVKSIELLDSKGRKRSYYESDPTIGYMLCTMASINRGVGEQVRIQFPFKEQKSR